MTIKITGMQIKRSKPNRGGSRVMANFDFHTPDLGMKGCVLSLNPEGKWRVWTPMIDPLASAKDRKIQQVCVYWRSGSTMEQQVLDAALALYKQLSDDDEFDAPYEPREYPEPSDRQHNARNAARRFAEKATVSRDDEDEEDMGAVEGLHRFLGAAETAE